MKKYLLIAVFAVLGLGVVLVALLLLNFKGQPLPTSIQEAKCDMVITVQGQAMAPAIQPGTKLILNKCADKRDIPAGTIVLFDENNVRMIGRVKERTSSQDDVSYKIGQDGRPQQEFTVPADRIIAQANDNQAKE